MTRRPGTLAVASIMVLMFALQLLLAPDAPLEVLAYPDPEMLRDAGAAYTGMDLRQEWERIVASTFLHGGILHLMVNLAALMQLGYLLEVFFGTTTFAASFLLGAAGAALATFLVPAPPDIVYVGASGGIFAVAGTLIVGLRRIWREERARWSHRFSSRLTGCMAMNLVFGVAVSAVAASVGAGFVVANTAHVGGLLTGALIGLLPLRMRRNDETLRIIRRMEPPPEPPPPPPAPHDPL